MKYIKNKKSLIYLIIILIILVIGVCFIYNIRHKKSESKKTSTNSKNVYKITYFDDLTPGSTSEITIYKDKLDIKTTYGCSYIDCSPKIEKETFTYSKANVDKLNNYVRANFFNHSEIHHFELEEQQQKVIQGILRGEYFFETNVEEYKYKVEYWKDNSVTYNVYLKNDGKILVKKLDLNKDYDIEKVHTYYLDFSKENINEIYNYIEKESKREKSKIIYKDSTLKKHEKNIFISIVENDETYLKNINEQTELSYTISYNGIECFTPTLYLYTDNTYEYYYTYSNDNKELTPKTGIYNYDITKIIENINKYEENKFGTYIIKDNLDNEYITYNNNVELQELLNSINITLEKCLEAE